LYLLHVDLEEAALYVEFDGLVSFLNALKEVGEHPREQTLEFFVVVVGTLNSQIVNGLSHLPP
jgi:hypothetical protein